MTRLRVNCRAVLRRLLRRPDRTVTDVSRIPLFAFLRNLSLKDSKSCRGKVRVQQRTRDSIRTRVVFSAAKLRLVRTGKITFARPDYVSAYRIEAGNLFANGK